MSFGTTEIKMVREATGVARGVPSVSSADRLTLGRLDIALGAGGVAMTWQDWTDARILRVLLDATGDAYKNAITEFANAVHLTIPFSVVPSPVVQPTIPWVTSFSDFEIQKLGDLNYRAREYLHNTGTLVNRLLVLAARIKARTWSDWQDTDRSYILSLMGSTDYGNDPQARPILLRFAEALGTTVSNVVFPTAPDPVTPPVTPPPVAEPLPEMDYGLWDTTPTPLVAGPSGEGLAREVLDILRNNTVRFDKNVGYRMWPIQNTEAPMTLFNGGIIGVAVSNFQNDDEQMLPAGVIPKHANYLDICNGDGGGRWLQYCWWYMGKIVRNTLNRSVSIRAIFDSMGESCWSFGAATGQRLYQRLRPNGDINISAFQPNAKINLLGSSTYGAEDIDLIEQAVEKALKARGLW